MSQPRHMDVRIRYRGKTFKLMHVACTSVDGIKSALYRGYHDHGVPSPSAQELIWSGKVLSDHVLDEMARKAAASTAPLTLMLIEKPAPKRATTIAVRYVNGSVVPNLTVDPAHTVAEVAENALRLFARRLELQPSVAQAPHVLFANDMLLDDSLAFLAYDLGPEPMVYLLPSLDAAGLPATPEAEAGAAKGAEGKRPSAAPSAGPMVASIHIPMEVFAACMRPQQPAPAARDCGNEHASRGIPAVIRSGLATTARRPAGPTLAAVAESLDLDSVARELEGAFSKSSVAFLPMPAEASVSSETIYRQVVQRLERNFSRPTPVKVPASQATSSAERRPGTPPSAPKVRGLRKGFLCGDTKGGSSRRAPRRSATTCKRRLDDPAAPGNSDKTQRLMASKLAHDATPGETPGSTKLRCCACAKKVPVVASLTGKCRCGQVFCTSCLLPQAHRCTFDYKAAARSSVMASIQPSYVKGAAEQQARRGDI
mmetsp:Transcript_4199/g.14037  ORF Transcript_4199/g.14037 Transcript_4199/m.14037 type:complete len:484 (-) Transcript_4199:168-1619(-)